MKKYKVINLNIDVYNIEMTLPNNKRLLYLDPIYYSYDSENHFCYLNIDIVSRTIYWYLRGLMFMSSGIPDFTKVL
jgi:hypothetical protein